MKLNDRVALITGGGTGIGKGIARVLVKEGAKLMLAQRRLAVVQQTAVELDPSGTRVKARACDVSSRQQVQQLVKETLAEFGQIDILVNNAAITGMPALSPFLGCSDETWDTILNVNLKGAFMCSQEVARHMVSRGKGVILNISSVGAFAAQQQAAAYCASKAGMEGLTKAMALELASEGVRVNCIAPGDIVVEKNQLIAEELARVGVKRDYVRKTPLARRGLPEEIGHAAAFLASDGASFVHGATLIVDGGFLIY
jgi:NAD(P)-dependent dehydrogenase (short-subunit alcohol dehydrogenase family)